MKNIIGSQISSLRASRGMTQEELAIKLGYSKQTISNWETGLKTPRMGAIQKLADLFKVNKSYIIEGENNKSPIEPIYSKLEPKRKDYIYNLAEQQLKEQETLSNKIIPLVGKTVANPTVIEYGDVDIEQQSFSHVPEGADCAINIQGDSMEPLIKDGSIVFYKRQEDVESGEIAVVEINGDGATCKRVIKNYDNRNIILRSVNENYEDRVLHDEDVRIIGKVIL